MGGHWPPFQKQLYSPGEILLGISVGENARRKCQTVGMDNSFKRFGCNGSSDTNAGRLRGGR